MALHTDVHIKNSPRTRRPCRGMLRNDFVLLWFGQTVSKIGNGAYKVAVAWSVYGISHSTAAMGLVLALNVVPELVLAMLGGAIADRFSRRAVVIAADGIAAVVTLGLALTSAFSTLTMSMLMSAAFLLGVVSAFYGPAYAALRGELRGIGSRRTANAWFTVSGNLARMAGPALAGIAFAAGGASTVFGLDAASFAFAFVTSYLMSLPASRDAPEPASAVSASQPPSVMREIAQGLAYTVKARWLVVTLAVSLVANLACLAPYAVLLPAVVTERGAGIDLLGLLSATEIGVGILGAMVIGKFSARLRPGIAMLGLCGLLGAGTLLLGLPGGHTSLLFAGVALIGLGLAFDVVEQTLLQSLVPDRLLSRVYAVNTVVSYSLLPLGYSVAGLVARHVSASPVLAVGGAILIVSCGLAAPLPAVRRLNAISC
jgi:MFS family permease